MLEYFRYVFKLKPNEKPNYRYLRDLSLKFCQRFYIKNSTTSCYDWYTVPPGKEEKYRSKMLNYFFVSNTFFPTIKSNNISTYEDNLLKPNFDESTPKVKPKASIDYLGNFTNSGGNCFILETQEDHETTRNFGSIVTVDYAEESENVMTTARNSPQNQVYIKNRSRFYQSKI
jgi:hypothetical protein